MMRSFLLVCLLIPTVCRAQSDTAFVRKSVAKAVTVYEASMKSQPAYFNGPAYTEPRTTRTEHPYFLSDDWIDGAITYEGYHFANLPLRFDIASNTLVTESYNAKMLALVKDKLSTFEISDHHFAMINNASVNNSLPETGYYEILYDGPSRLVLWHHKEMQKNIVTQVYVYGVDNNNKLYLEKHKYYVLVNDHYVSVSGKKSLLSVFRQQKSTLKKYIRQQRLDFSTNREKSMAAVAAYYDSLTRN